MVRTTDYWDPRFALLQQTLVKAMSRHVFSTGDTLLCQPKLQLDGVHVILSYLLWTGAHLVSCPAVTRQAPKITSGCIAPYFWGGGMNAEVITRIKNCHCTLRSITAQ